MVAFGIFCLTIFSDSEDDTLDEDTKYGERFYLASCASLVSGGILLGISEALSTVESPDATSEVKTIFGGEAVYDRYVPKTPRNVDEFINDGNKPGPLLQGAPAKAN